MIVINNTKYNDLPWILSPLILPKYSGKYDVLVFNKSKQEYYISDALYDADKNNWNEVESVIAWSHKSIQDPNEQRQWIIKHKNDICDVFGIDASEFKSNDYEVHRTVSELIEYYPWSCCYEFIKYIDGIYIINYKDLLIFKK